jgi:hypothetical protein
VRGPRPILSSKTGAPSRRVDLSGEPSKLRRAIRDLEADGTGGTPPPEAKRPSQSYPERTERRDDGLDAALKMMGGHFVDVPEKSKRDVEAFRQHPAQTAQPLRPLVPSSPVKIHYVGLRRDGEKRPDHNVRNSR